MPAHRRRSRLHALASEPVPALAPHTDFLSRALMLIRLRGELVYASELRAPWGLRFDRGSAHFHVVAEGRMRVEAPDGAHVDAVAGDLVLLPRGGGHTIGTDVASAIPARDVLAAQLRSDRLQVRLGGRGAVTRLVTGAFRFEGDNLPSMLGVLPPLIHLPEAAHAGASSWLDGLGDHLLAEATAAHPGAAIMISRLIDVLVIHAMRTWIRVAPPEDKGWLGALADDRISRALKAIHDEPFRRWTVAGLASLAGMSRSSFADRFTTLIGAPPLHYQTRWRLLLAHEMLVRPGALVGQVARDVGYESEAAFSRAFKAQFGVAPGAVRRGA
jgi:AraC-like DNA-binding protein